MSLFESSNLRVDTVDGFNSDVVLVSFAERKTYQARLDEQGFGQDFARKNSIDGIYVKCIGNHWYQYPEIPDALSAIRQAAGGRNIVTYGSSMGAYAAIKFAGVLNAERVVAISPLFSPDPAKPPFERRWKVDADQITFLDDKINMAPETHVYVLTDPAHADAKHARLFRATLSNSTIVAVPLASHPVGHFLREAGLLADLITSLISGRFDNRRWCTARRASRTRSSIYNKRLAEVIAERTSLHRDAKRAASAAE
jgi:pimeloyl-ACP methyl ester carboxylesterase